MTIKPNRQNWKNLFRVALALVPCGVVASAVPAVAQEAQTQQAAIASFETVGLGNRSGCAKRALMTITDEAEWKRVWGVHVQGDAQAPEMPAVDFSKQMVVALLAGAQTSAKTIQVAQVVRSSRETVVYYLVADEDTSWNQVAGQAATAGSSQPFHFAVIDRTDAPVRFADALLGEAGCRKCGG